MKARSIVAIAATALTVSVSGVQAQQASEASSSARAVPVTVTARLGASSLHGNGDVFHLFGRDLGLGPSSFDAASLELEVAASVGTRTELFLGGIIRGSQEAETRAWDHIQGFEDAAQWTRLSVTPGFHAGARAYLFERGGAMARQAQGSANPYAALAVGRGSYALRQWGEFVDAVSQEGFDATFMTRGSYLWAFVGAGIDFSITPTFILNMQARRDFGSPSPDGDFQRFDDLALGGTTLSVGGRVRRP